MKRTIIFTVLLALVASLPLAAQSTLSRVYDELEIDLWTDQDDGTNYTEGDEITIYFSASRDCYVTIFDLDTRGNINLIFPDSPDGNHFIEGGELYELPSPDEDYVFTVSGPPGDEYIQMIASTKPYEVPDWRAPISVHDDYWSFDYDDDADQFLFNIASHYFPVQDIAYDQVSFYVAPKYYYKRTASDCSGDCGTVYVDYPQGCDVYVDGIYWGAAPLWIPSIYLGRHRVSVYWGTSIVYHDWIYIDYFDPYFVRPYSHYMYDYTYRHWYPYRYYDYFYGPSQFKYKKRSYYAFGRPDARPGYDVVANKHGKYKKSRSYGAEKSKRLGKYKAKHGYNNSTKTYSSVTKGKVTTTARKGSTRTVSDIKGAGSKGRKGNTTLPGWQGYGNDGKSASKGTKTKLKGSDKKNTTKSTTKSTRKTIKGSGSVKGGVTGNKGGSSGSGERKSGIVKKRASIGSKSKGSGTIGTRKSPTSSGKKSTSVNKRPSSSKKPSSSGSVNKKPSSSGSKKSGSVSKKPSGSGSRKSSGSVSKRSSGSAPAAKSSGGSAKSSGGRKKK